MMTERDLNVAGELKAKLSEVVELLDFRVFGSRARGDADEHSDMDVFLEVEYLDRSLRAKVEDIVWEVGFENFIVISPLILTRDEVENSPLRSSPIIQSVTEEGVKV
jgi:predicted nucleotidyltransferase